MRDISIRKCCCYGNTKNCHAYESTVEFFYINEKSKEDDLLIIFMLILMFKISGGGFHLKKN